MRKLKLFLSLLMVMLLSIGQVWATDFTLSSAAEVSQDGITVSFAKSSGSNAPAWYSAGLRLYGSNTITITCDNNITGVTFNWEKQGSKAFASATADVGNYSHPTAAGTGTWSGSAKTIVFTLGSSGQLQLNTFSVTIEEGGGSDPALSAAPAVIDFGTVDKGASVEPQDVTVTFENLTGSVTYSGLSGAFAASGTIAATGNKITITPNTANTGNFQQTLTVQSTADSKSAEVTVKMNVVEPFDGLELTFPDDGDEGANASGYTVSWTATKNSHDWSIYGFNSNKWQNGWTYIKAGRKSASGNVAQPVTATIVTQVTGHAIGDIVVTVNAVTAAQITSHKLYVADNSSFDGAIEIDGDPAPIAAGDITYTVPVANRANDLYYKLEYATAGTAGSNGTLTISKITYAYATATPQKPSAGLAFDAAQKLVKVGGTLTAPDLSTADGFDGTVTYASSDEAVVKVNASTGAITEIVAAGKAVITAHSDETENFKEGSASYTIFVAAQAGTEADPLTEASAKAVIDLGCTLSAYVKGTVASAHTMTSAGQVTVVLAGGMQFFHMLSIGGEAFTTETLPEFTAGDVVTAVGGLFKYNNSTYELEENCQMVDRIPYTAPKTPIANTKETAYTVAQALEFAADPVTYETTDPVYIKGVVYQFDYYGSTSNIYIRDEEKTPADGKFEFFKCAGLKIGEADPVAFEEDGVVELDTVIGYGVMTYFSKNDIWEFPEVNYVVEHKHYIAPVVSVTGVELNKESTSLEVGETETLVATVAPATATNKAVTWASDDETVATVDENGVVTAVAAGTATITVTTTDGSFTDDCEVTVTAADPTKHVVTFDATVDMGESPLSKSNITFTCSNGVLNNESEYRLYKSSTTTFACSVGNITKIEFTGVSGNPVSGFGDPEVGTLVTEGNNGVWTGNAESVSFVASGAQVRATEIVVTYKEDNRAAAGLTWSTDAVELTVGDEFTAPTLNNPNSIAAGEITIESSNTSLATVTAGVVALVADATGEATITATFAGNDDYKPATVSYNITVNEAGLDNVTFDSSEDHAESGETTITKGGFTLSFTSGSMDGTQAEYRLYKSQTMTLSSTDYLIKKIEFTCTSGNPISGFADATGLDKDNNEWTGESSTVELTASNAQVRMTKIKVFYVDDTRAAAGLAWNPADDIEITVGDAFSAPALLNPNSIDAAEITIESSNTSLATVTNGEVALVADATGTTTITATFAGNDDFKPATVSYKITVNPAYSIYVQPSLNVNFGSVEQDAEVADKKVTVTFTNVPAATLTLEGAGASAFTISPAAALTASGDITISASSANIGTFAATLTISDDANNTESKVVNLSITVTEPVVAETAVATDSKWVAATEIADGMQVLIVGVNNTDYSAMGVQNNNNRAAVAASVDGEGVLTPGENTMAFTVVEQSDGTFALRTSNGKYLYAASSSSNYLRSQDELDDNGRWTLTVTSAVANGTYTHKMMQFNSSSSIFACYTTSTTTQKPIALYVPKQDTPEPPVVNYTEVRNYLTEGWYYTMCLDKAVTAVKAGSIWRVLSKAANGNDVILEEVTGTLDAGRPYIFRAAASTLEVAYTGDAVLAPVNDDDNNGLVGSFTQEPIAQSPNNFIIYNNALYYVNSDNVKVGAHRAYLDMTDVPVYSNEPQQGAPRRRVTMAVHGEQTTTGIDALNAAEAPVKVLINGQMYILRGEKMFNANGQLVK